MSKRTRSLLIAVVALVALVCMLLGVMFLIPEDEGTGNGSTTTPTTKDESVILVEKGKDVTVKNVQVTLPEETYTISINTDKDLMVKGFDGLPQSADAYETLEEALLGFGAYRAINVENPEDYGFDTDNPTVKIHVEYSDNTDYAFELGKSTPSGDGYYLRRDDSDAIYLVDAAFADVVSAKSTSYLSPMPLVAPTADSANDELVVREVTLSGAVRPEPFTFQISTEVPEDGQQAQMVSGFYLTKPYLRNVKSNTQMLASSTYYGFTASDIAKVRPTAADLKKYGFDKPYSQCVADLAIRRTKSEIDKTTGKEVKSISFYNTFRYVLKLGNETANGDRYALLYNDDEMIPIVYTVTPSTVLWAEAQYDDIADELLFFTYIYQVEKMSITVDGKTTAFDLYHNADAEDRDAQLTVVADGVRYNTPSFRTLYTRLMEIVRKGSLDKKPTGEPIMSIDIVTNTSIAHTGWIKIYPHTSGKYAVLHDTGELHLVDATRVEGFIEDYRKFLKGENLG